MADRRSLGMLGLVLGGVTAAVMLIAALVVTHHVNSRVTFDTSRSAIAAAVQPVSR